MQHILLRNKRWRLLFTSLNREQCDGICDPPVARSKRIRISSSLGEEKTLEVLIHEMLHACSWDTAEEAVDESARDIARVLWNLGYRRTDANT